MTHAKDRARQILAQATADNADQPIGVDKHRVRLIAKALEDAAQESWPDDVLRWHEAMGLDCSGNPELGMRLIDEEADELDEAVKSGDRAAILKESLDLVWVILGNLNRHGISPAQVSDGWRELVRSNHSKVGAPRDENGKLTKGPRYLPADMAAVLGGER